MLRTQDVNHAVSRDWIAQWTGTGHIIAAPTLFLVEVGGAVSRPLNSPALGRRAIADVLDDPTIRLLPVDQSLAEAAARYAADLLLRGADAVYVALAEHLGVPLITWDSEQLARAASVIDVRTPAV
jgi:predicted nucleic acid-binding protein